MNEAASGHAAGATDETALVAALRAGHDWAYEALVRREGGRMLSVARRILANEEDARDAVQDAFISAFRGLDRFEGGSRISTWLHRIVVNRALMKLRTRRRKPETSIEELLPVFAEDGHHALEFQPWSEPIDETLSRAETRRAVRDAIGRLPEAYRIVLLLRDIEGKDTAETAATLGLSTNAVKIRLHRARQALRALLDPTFRRTPA